MPDSDESFELLSNLRPHERERLIKVAGLNDRQWKRIEEVTELDKEEWELLKEGVSLVRSMRAVGKFGRVVLVALIGAFLTIVSVGIAIGQLRNLFLWGPK